MPSTKPSGGSVAAEWDDLDCELAVLDEAVVTPAQPLLEATGPSGPGVYFTLYRGRLRLYARIADGTWPACVGSAKDCRERLGRHRGNCRSIRNLGRGGDLAVVVVETASEAAARYAEALCIARLQPIWNQPWVAGWGSKDQGGTRRAQAPPPFALLHPGRAVGKGVSTVDTSLLRRRVTKHLAATAMPLWSPLR